MKGMYGWGQTCCYSPFLRVDLACVYAGLKDTTHVLPKSFNLAPEVTVHAQRVTNPTLYKIEQTTFFHGFTVCGIDKGLQPDLTAISSIERCAELGPPPWPLAPSGLLGAFLFRPKLQRRRKAVVCLWQGPARARCEGQMMRRMCERVRWVTECNCA
jgi:hypothetical protein